MQKLVNGKWLETNQAGIVDGDVCRTPIGGKIVNGALVGNGWEQKTYHTPLPEPAPQKLVGMGDLGELLTDEVLVELIDYSNDKTANQAIRNGATRIMVRIKSNQKIDVLDPAFITLLQSLVQFTSLTLIQATEIFDKLKK